MGRTSSCPVFRVGPGSLCREQSRTHTPRRSCTSLSGHLGISKHTTQTHVDTRAPTHTHGGAHRCVQAHRCDKGSWQLSREQHWTGLKAVRWISHNYCGGDSSLAETTCRRLGLGRTGGRREVTEGRVEQQNTCWDTAHSAVWQQWDFLGVTLHCMQASSFHDEGSDLGPLQWK